MPVWSVKYTLTKWPLGEKLDACVLCVHTCVCIHCFASWSSICQQLWGLGGREGMTGIAHVSFWSQTLIWDPTGGCPLLLGQGAAVTFACPALPYPSKQEVLVL